MRARDLDLNELLHVDPNGGILRLANERVLLLDAVALGLSASFNAPIPPARFGVFRM